MQSIKSANPSEFSLMYYRNGDLRKTVNDSHVTISLIARPGTKFSQTGVDRYEHGTLAPTIVLKYTRGIEGFSMRILIITNFSLCSINRF